MSVKQTVFLMLASASALVAAADGYAAEPNQEFGEFISQIGGSTNVKTLQGSRLSGIARVTRAVSTSPVSESPVTPNDANEDARENFGYDFFTPTMSGYRFFNIDNKADQLAPAKAAHAKFSEECTANNGTLEPEESSVATRFSQENGDRFRVSDKYFNNSVATAVCVGPNQQPLGGFVAITRTLKEKVFFVRTNRTSVYAIKGGGIASTAMLAAEEKERLQLQASAQERERQAQLIAAAEQRKLATSRKPEPKNGNAASSTNPAQQTEEYDPQGRRIVRGPIQSSYVSNLHIISNSIGIISNVGVTVSNSVIEAPVCMSVPSSGNSVSNNVLNCDLGIEFGPGPLLNNRLINNQYRGRLSNRPNTF